MVLISNLSSFNSLLCLTPLTFTRLEREREEARAADARAAAILAAEAAEAEQLRGEIEVDEAEAEMFRHLRDLDTHLTNEGDIEQDIEGEKGGK